MLKYVVLGGTALLVAFVLTPWVAAVGRWLEAVDEPGGRRVHSGRVPRLGGLAVFAALLAALVVALLTGQFLFPLYHGSGRWAWLVLGAVVVTACGMADDLWSVGPMTKLASQLLAGMLVLGGGFGIWVLSNPLTGHPMQLGWLGIPLTLLWVVGVTNALNLIDGLDGLAAGVGLITSVTLFVISLATGRIDVALVAVALAGALAGFLYHNFHPAAVFLGDSGALLLGYLLSVLSIEGAHKGATAVVMVVPILALGLPIADTLLSMLRRVLGALRVVRVDPDRNEYSFHLIGSASIFRADRDHIHHRLLRLGLTYQRVVMVLYGVCVLLGVLAFLAVSLRGAQLAVLVGLTALMSYVGLRQLGYKEVQVLRQGTLLPLFDSRVLSRRSFHAMVDAVFVGAAYAAATLVAEDFRVDEARTYFLWTLLPVVALQVSIFMYGGLYQRAYRYANAADLLAVLKWVLVAQALATVSVVLVYGPPPRPLVVLLLDFYFSATLVLGARVSFRMLEVMKAEAAANARPVLIYGAGHGGTALLREAAQNPDLGFHVVGFVDDPPARWRSHVNGVPVLGGLQQLPDLVRQHRVQEVILAHHALAAGQIDAIAAACSGAGVPLRRFRFSLETIASRSRR